MGHRNQHWIPRSYLAAWTDPAVPEKQEPYVWVFPKHGGPGRKRAPRNIFSETDIYTIRLPEGHRDLSLEHGLATLESRFVSIRRKLDSGQSLDEEEHLALIAFAAAMHSRTPRVRERRMDAWGEVLEQMESLERAMRAKPPEEKDAIARMSSALRSGEPSLYVDDVRKLATEPLQHSMVSEIEAMVPLLMTMDVAVLRTEDDIGFITTDAPCVVYDPDARNRPFPYNATGLGYDSVEVTLPLSPSQALLLNRRGVRGYLEASPALVEELNRMTRGFSHEHFVVRRDKTNPEWYCLQPREDREKP